MPYSIKRGNCFRKFRNFWNFFENVENFWDVLKLFDNFMGSSDPEPSADDVDIDMLLNQNDSSKVIEPQE